jgi:hypothetical protein
MAKRFSDSEKWQDVWFTELTNDQKIIWIYLLDHCDNAGIFKLNIKLINFNCSTNISVEDFISIFKDRITQINKESWLINKFCVFQYGPDFLTSSNKAVISAIKKLQEVNIIKLVDGVHTISIPYQSPINTISIGDKYPIDSPKDKEQDKDENKDKFINKNEEQKELKEYEKNMLKEAIKNMVIPQDIKECFESMVDGANTPRQRDRVFEYETTINKIPGIKQFLETFKY